MNTKTLVDIIGNLLEMEVNEPEFIDSENVVDLRWGSFEEEGILTSDDGIIVKARFADGSSREFQITVLETGRRW